MRTKWREQCHRGHSNVKESITSKRHMRNYCLGDNHACFLASMVSGLNRLQNRLRGSRWRRIHHVSRQSLRRFCLDGPALLNFARLVPP